MSNRIDNIIGRLLLGIITVGVITGILAGMFLIYCVFMDIGLKLFLIVVGIYIVGSLIENIL